MEEHCRTQAAYNWTRCRAAAEAALPWFDHRSFGGRDNIEVEGLSLDQAQPDLSGEGY
jgi:hypothetical protein